MAEQPQTMTQQPRIIRFVYKFPVVLLALCGYMYSIWLIFNLREDTTALTNAGFAIMASLAALSFSFARVIEAEDLRDRVMFAGERLLHGAILVLVASLLKYFVLLSLKLPTFATPSGYEVALVFTVGMLVAIVFTNAVMFAHTGLRVLNDLLLMRFTRHHDWDDIV